MSSEIYENITLTHYFQRVPYIQSLPASIIINMFAIQSLVVSKNKNDKILEAHSRCPTWSLTIFSQSALGQHPSTNACSVASRSRVEWILALFKQGPCSFGDTGSQEDSTPLPCRQPTWAS